MLEQHGLTTLGTKDLVWWYRQDGFLASIVERGEVGKLCLQCDEFGSLGGSEETVVANLHKMMRQDVLEETLDEFFGGEGATLELSIVGSTVEEGDTGRCHVTRVKATD